MNVTTALRCAACGHQNREFARFCGHCGAPLAARPDSGGPIRPRIERIAFRRWPTVQAREKPYLGVRHFEGWQWVGLATIVFVGLVTRLVRLGDFPDTLHPDEADFLQDALRILHGAPRDNGFFGFDWTPEPAMSIYLLAAFVRLFGENVLAARLPSALLSAIALIPFFLLLRRQFPAWASLAGTFLLATSLWYLQFSRSAWNNVQVSLCMLLAMLCLLMALHRMGQRSWKTWALFTVSGVACSLGLYGYFAGRAILLATFVFFVVSLCMGKFSWPFVAGFALLGAVVWVLFAPEGMYIASHWQAFNGRTGTVLIFNSAQFKSSPVATIAGQVIKNVAAFWIGAVNNNPRYTPVGEPLLERFTGLLALLGLACGIASRKFRRWPEFPLWLTMMLVAWFFTEILTTNTPDGARGVAWMPALMYFATLGMVALADWLHEINPALDRAAASALGVGALAIGAGQVAHYVQWQQQSATRQVRLPYVTVQEFPQWLATVDDRADHRQGLLSAGEWRASHPLPAQVSPV